MQIIWLEDQRSTIINLKKHLSGFEGVKIQTVSTPLEFKVFIEREYPKGLKETKPPLCLVDILLYGVHNLKSIGIENASTAKGKNAGYVFAERFLVEPRSPWRSCPIAFVTEREIDTELQDDVAYLKKKASAGMEIFQKLADADTLRLTEYVKAWIDHEV